MHAYNGNVITRAALQLSPLLFQRPRRLWLAHWEDVDLDHAPWRCPPEKPRYMSDNTINSALRTLGYDTREQITGHGFRATARTLILELLGCDRKVIERHLAHGSDDELDSAYDAPLF